MIRPTRSSLLSALVLVPVLTPFECVQARTEPAPAELAPAPRLNLDLSAAYLQPESGSGAADPAAARETRFGRAGSRWWSIGSGVAHDFSDATDVNLHGIYSTFLADELEFGIEAAGWYFNQRGQDTGGLSGSMIFRWHFLHWGDDEGAGAQPGDTAGSGGAANSDGFKTTIFADVGIGVLAAFDNVPDGGTGFNFLPRAGVGLTHALTDDSAGPRLTLGIRWHHISNARISGDERNPGRDALMGYVEVQFPF